MPYVPSKDKCDELGCTSPKSKCNRFCLAHGGSDTPKYYNTDKRRHANAMYDTSYWKKARVNALSLNPLCAACLCEGIVTSATEVDHVFPWTQIGKEAFYRNYLQSLCNSHHSMKTQLERRGTILHWTSQHKFVYSLEDYKNANFG